MSKPKVSRAIIPLGGAGHDRLPLQSLESGLGKKTSVIEYQITQLMDAGIENLALVVSDGFRELLSATLKGYGSQLTYIPQIDAKGFGNALVCAEQWIADEPFLVQVCDHFFISHQSKSCVSQLLEAYETHGTSIVALNRIDEQEVHRLGIVQGRRMAQDSSVYQIQQVLEKPSLTQAEQLPHVSGLKSREYLGLAGLSVFTPGFMGILSRLAKDGDGSRARWLNHAMVELMKHETCMGMEIDGRRINLEEPYGLVRAQIALALSSEDQVFMNSLLLQEVALRLERGNHEKN